MAECGKHSTTIYFVLNVLPGGFIGQLGLGADLARVTRPPPAASPFLPWSQQRVHPPKLRPWRLRPVSIR